MSKFLVTVGGKLGIFVALVTDNGIQCNDAMDREYFSKRDGAAAEKASDFDSMAVEVNAFLLSSPGLRTIAGPELIRAIERNRVRSGVYTHPEHTVTVKDPLTGYEEEKTIAATPFTREEETAAYNRLEEVLPAYLRAHPEQFHIGRGKGGVAVRYVVGESVKDESGEYLVNANGDKVQAYRHTAEEWAKCTAKKKEDSAPVSVK